MLCFAQGTFWSQGRYTNMSKSCTCWQSARHLSLSHKEQSMSHQCLKPLVTEFFLHLGVGYEGWFLCEVILTFTLYSTMTPKTKQCWTWKVKRETTLWPQRSAWVSRSSSICSVLLSLKVFSSQPNHYFFKWKRT